MLCNAMLRNVMRVCYAMLCYVVLCYVMLCYAVLCYVMLCYVVLCYVMLCYVMLCYVMLCSVMYAYREHPGAQKKSPYSERLEKESFQERNVFPSKKGLFGECFNPAMYQLAWGRGRSVLDMLQSLYGPSSIAKRLCRDLERYFNSMELDVGLPLAMAW